METITTKLDQELKYREYIKEHKANVLAAYNMYGEQLASRLGISLSILWLNVKMHDESKYSDEEYNAYRRKFFPCSFEKANPKDFEMAWHHHLSSNPHHPEYWTYVDDNKEPRILDMPDIYIAEMLLDWQAMSMKFNNTIREYYEKNRDSKPISDDTKKKIDSVIDIFDEVK